MDNVAMQNKNNTKTSALLCDLSNDITDIINQHHAMPVVDGQRLSVGPSASQRKIIEEKIWLAIINTLKKYHYRSTLLFNGQASNSHDEAMFYVQNVLLKRPQLINKQLENPTAIHRLLGSYIKQGWYGLWQDSQLVRALNKMEYWVDPIFSVIAKILQTQRIGLGSQYSGISSRRLQEFGPYCLSAGENTVFVAEEINLEDVFKSIPFPIKPQAPIRRYKTTDTPSTSELLKNVLDSLNARYGKLVAAGMDPKTWLMLIEDMGGDDDGKPVKFTDQKLRELSKLLKQLRKDQRRTFNAGQNWDEAKAFCTIYKELSGIPRNGALKPPSDFAGFDNAGQAYQFYCAKLKAAANSNTEVDPDDVSDQEPATEDQLYQAQILKLPVTYAGDFNAITTYVWQLINSDDQAGLCDKRGIYLLNHTQLKSMVIAYPALGYADLNDQALLYRLRQELATIIQKHLPGVQHG